ncbi:glycosyl hydrolase [Pedobacter sp. MR2016-24]|uniref:glycosyl hydrolase n=1 Tax=Pedobacter sp. MR2016-24 TaxID=2994466 RepID=UPI00224838A4|nr:glycosyl hydrolase [Pedobacter sp. MR2016-24]MCX2484411.1 glycosyl hydrolase [Pedobacter sp. MR2016-24]
MKKLTDLRFLFPVLWLSFCLPLISLAQQNDDAKPWVLWYWVKAGVSKPGITADLEAMKANGIGGAYLVTIQGADPTPLYSPAAVQLTPEWWQMVKFAMSEAKRLDLKMGMHISDGFALAGGPWISPELSMQKVVWSGVNVTGDTGKIVLPQPESKENYYRDIAVYAYPSAVGSGLSTRTIQPKITASNGADATGLVKDGNKQSFGSNEPCYIQYEFEQPFTCRSITIKTGGNNYQAQRLAVEVSNDGKTFHSIGRLEPPRHGWQDTDEDVTHSIKTTTAKFYRFVYDKKGSEPGAEDLDAAKWKPSLKLLNLELFAEARINQFEGKNGSVWRVSHRSTSAEIPKELCIPLSQLINITDRLKADGSLNWTQPPGNWTVLRVGHTSTGHTNATGGGGKGLESDKFNPEATRLQIKNWYGAALKHAGPELAKKVLSVFYVDSWECGSQNWSPVFRAEFLKRRGYDITKYLPIMTGLPVENVAVSENFLYDVRKTISELIADNFYKTLAGFAKEKGLRFTAESVAPTMMSDGLLHYKTVDMPMGEFWLNSPTHDKPNDMLDAVSAAHIYGKNIVQAEAFTTVRMDWNEHPGNMRTLLDRNYALGVNKLVYHVFTHNPWVDRKPGMTLDGVGLYFQRDQTWWKLGKAWVDYAARSQHLLQQGKPVTAIAVFTGEELPRRSVLPNRLVQTLPGIFGKDVVSAEKIRLANAGEPLRQIPSGVTHAANMADPENWVNPLRGYAYDSFNPDVLSTATVKNGNVVFSSGASYKVLVFTGKLSLNPNYQYISFETVKKLYELIKQGAKVIVAEKPLYQSGIRQTDATAFNKIVAEIWGGHFSSKIKHSESIIFKKLGLGLVYKAPFYGDDFSELGVERDLTVTEQTSGTPSYAKYVAFLHRKSADQDIYFISNQLDKVRELSFTFNIINKIPVVYDAVSNDTIKVNNWSFVNGKTALTLKLEANQSFFILFKQPAKASASGTGNNWLGYKTIQDISADWQAKFDPVDGGPVEPVIYHQLQDWTKSADTLVKYYSGTAIYTKKIIFNGDTDSKLWINAGDFSNIAGVKVNGLDCGTIWTAPHRVEISKAIRKGENLITIEIANTWGNRLIGDSKLPPEKRITNTTAPFRLAGKPLYPAGLVGPVTIQTEEK